jgi:hypothetical protein
VTLLNFANVTRIKAGDGGKRLLRQTAPLPLLADSGAKELQDGFLTGW